MLVTYNPEGGAPSSWPYVAARVRQSKAEAVEKYFGGTFEEFNKGILSGSARARKVLLWHCLTTEHPLMKFADTPDFAMAEVEVSFDVDELNRLKESIESSSADPDAKAATVARLDAMIAELPAPKALPLS